MRRATPRGVLQRVLLGTVAALTLACGDRANNADTAKADSAARLARDAGVIDPDTAGRTLAFATADSVYHIDETVGTAGSISGDVVLRGVLPPDTTVTPDRDSTGCRPFDDATFPRTRGARTAGARTAGSDSAEHNIGNAVVWLVGVTHGPRENFSRRVNLLLEDCHFEPRVQVAATGATINTGNRDNIVTKLHFVDYGHEGVPRVTIGFTDPGQVVPSSTALGKPGLVEVSSSTHPWMRAFIAVAPHPFVAVTEADGAFLFEGVPTGSYQLVVWHERLKSQVLPVRVEAGITTRVGVRY